MKVCGKQNDHLSKENSSKVIEVTDKIPDNTDAAMDDHAEASKENSSKAVPVAA